MQRVVSTPISVSELTEEATVTEVHPHFEHIGAFVAENKDGLRMWCAFEGECVESLENPGTWVQLNFGELTIMERRNRISEGTHIELAGLIIDESESRFGAKKTLFWHRVP